MVLRACQDQDFENKTDKLLKRKGRPLSDYVWLGLGICGQYSRCFAAILIGSGEGDGRGFLSHQAPRPWVRGDLENPCLSQYCPLSLLLCLEATYCPHLYCSKTSLTCPAGPIRMVIQTFIPEWLPTAYRAFSLVSLHSHLLSLRRQGRQYPLHFVVRRWRPREASRFLCQVVFEWHLTEIPHTWPLGEGREVRFLGRAGITAAKMCLMGSPASHLFFRSSLLSSVSFIFLESGSPSALLRFFCHCPRSSDDSADTGIGGMFCLLTLQDDVRHALLTDSTPGDKAVL